MHPARRPAFVVHGSEGECQRLPLQHPPNNTPAQRSAPPQSTPARMIAPTTATGFIGSFMRSATPRPPQSGDHRSERQDGQAVGQPDGNADGKHRVEVEELDQKMSRRDENPAGGILRLAADAISQQDEEGACKAGDHADECRGPDPGDQAWLPSFRRQRIPPPGGRAADRLPVALRTGSSSRLRPARGTSLPSGGAGCSSSRAAWSGGRP